jgi:hypothetical protein
MECVCHPIAVRLAGRNRAVLTGVAAAVAAAPTGLAATTRGSASILETAHLIAGVNRAVLTAADRFVVCVRPDNCVLIPGPALLQGPVSRHASGSHVGPMAAVEAAANVRTVLAARTMGNAS